MLRSLLSTTLLLGGVASVGFLGGSFGMAAPEGLAAPAVATPAVTATPPATDPDPDGQELFQLVCAMCHTLEPPPNLAPPMSHAAAYYLHGFETEEEAVAAMVAFMREPTEAASLLPAMAIERFGLMPPQAHLSQEQLEAVARYSLTLADTTHGRGGMQHDGPHR